MPKNSENVSLEKRDDVLIIFVRNNLSYQTADELKAMYPQIQAKKILIDLGQVTLTTSRGMAALISIVLDADENNQQVVLCNLSTMCTNIIDAMDIMNHVTNLVLFDTLDQGLAYFRR
jgi:anti-anti-sigma factor